jgi:protein-tyrosine-phosphatase/DNA-binding transcriptional ArsR family regulator
MDIRQATQVFSALSQESRLAVLRLLTPVGPSGLPATEIAVRLGAPQSTTSFHLHALEEAGLVQSTRQGRRIIYALRFIALRNLLAFLTEACCAGRPELCGDLMALLPSLPEEHPTMTPAFNVLFLCTRNSARSIMAEAIIGAVAPDRFRAYSAGSEPAAAPMAEVLEKLRVLGHDVVGLRSKSWAEFLHPEAPRMDFVIALCDVLEGQTCPDFGATAVTAAWPLPDPGKFTGSAAERSALLNELYMSLGRRIGIFASLPFASLDRMAVRARLDELGAGPVGLAMRAGGR